MKIFVLLTSHLDAVAWAAKYRSHTSPDLSPYGYHHAEGDGRKITFSKPTPANGVIGGIMKLSRRVLGFDIGHVLANLADLRGHDVVWTHTEREHLALEFLRWISFGRLHIPPIISQSIWIMDEWPTLPAHKRFLFKKILKKADVLTFHSPENTKQAREMGLHQRCEIVPFGISLASFPIRDPKLELPVGRPIRVFTLGGDRHRDWDTLAAALAGHPEFEVQIASSTFPTKLAAPNFTISFRDQAGLVAGYAWADVVIVPLRHNFHASGLTVLLESVASGVPVVVSDTGGLSSYFAQDLVKYVPVKDHLAMREAVLELFKDPTKLATKVRTAQEHLLTADLTTIGYANRHVALSEELLKLR